jgi:hypothetical protein
MSDTNDVKEIKAVEATEARSSLVSRSSKLLLGGGFAASVIAHLSLGGIVLLASPRLFATVPVNSMVVDIVTPKEFAQATNAQPGQSGAETTAALTGSRSESQSKSEATLESKMEQTNVAPPRQTLQRAPPQAPPAVQPPLPSSPPQALQPPPPQRDSRSARVEEPASEPKHEEVPDPARIIDLLHLPVQVGDAASEAPPTESGTKLTSEEIAAFKGHLKTCWVPPTGATEVKRLKAVLRVALGPDGQLLGKPILLAASASLQGPALVESAMRALVQCQPYNTLPVDKYKEWKLLDLNFSQDDIADISSAQTTGKGGPRG